MKKKNLALIISAIVGLIIGTLAVIIYNEINGLSLIDMLTTTEGLTIIIVTTVWVIGIILYLVLSKIRRM